MKQQGFYAKHEKVMKVDDKEVYLIRLGNGSMHCAITNIGCSVLTIETPDREGNLANVVSGLAQAADYFVNRDYMGCIVGRCANRIADARFSLDGKEYTLTKNDPPNHLHGGAEGFHKKIWQLREIVDEAERVGVVFTLSSPDGDEGYPGNLSVTVSYFLNSNNQLCIQYEAETDQPTPVNLTSHLYFNLSGFEQPTIHDHLLQISAEGYLEKNRQNTPTGKVLPVAGTALDFRMEKRIGHDIASLQVDGGYDHHFVLGDAAQTAPLAAVLKDPSSGRTLRVYTTEPGMQVYTANYFDGTIAGQHNEPYQRHGAAALETQHCPDSPNQKGFPDITLRPGKKYTSTTIYEFSIS